MCGSFMTKVKSALEIRSPSIYINNIAPKLYDGILNVYIHPLANDTPPSNDTLL